MKISIIVPVYKTEKYLDKCIESILNQTFKDFELILVDDGSPDNCGKICDEWAKKDDRIVVIHKENGGVSSARNTALNNIKGEYVGFVDSDDTIEPTMYEKLYNNLIDSNAQISVCDFKFITPSGVQENKSEIKTEIYDSSVALEVVLKGKPFAGHLCNKLLVFRFLLHICILPDYLRFILHSLYMPHGYAVVTVKTSTRWRCVNY